MKPFFTLLQQRAQACFCMFVLLCSLLFACGGSQVMAAEAMFSPAFKTIGVWDAKTKIRADVNVWYPTKSKPSTATYGDWRLHVVRFGRAAEGRFPLILLSHDSASSRFSYHQSAALLASAGFVVMAPDHKNDNLQRMGSNFRWQQLAERRSELRVVLDMASSHREVRSMIDMSRIGILGFGTGATTALLLGGAKLDSEGWVNYCVQVPQSTTYCNAWAKGHVETMLEGLPPFEQSFADARLKAIVAVSPKYDFLLTQKALQSVTLPLVLLETEKDIAKKMWNEERMQSIFPSHTLFFSLDGIDTRDLMSACPPALRKDLPDLCGTVTPDERKVAHEIFNETVIHFFLEQLGLRTS